MTDEQYKCRLAFLGGSAFGFTMGMLSVLSILILSHFVIT